MLPNRHLWPPALVACALLAAAACGPSPTWTMGPRPHEGSPTFDLAPPMPDASARAASAASAASASATPAASAAPAAPTASAVAGAMPPEPTPDAALGRAARVLAGLSVETEKSGERPRLQAHARAATASFDDFEERAGKKMLAWSKEQLLAAEGATVFYPFAGPDLVTTHRFYPAAGRHVLVALQDGGEPPELAGLSTDELDHTLDIYERIFDAFARRGFFITAQMGAGYHTPRAARGICGVLMAFAEREGLRVIAAEPLRIKADGSDAEVHPGDRRAASTWASLRLHLRRDDGSRVLVDYLKLDLSDAGLRQDAAAAGFLARVARGPTLLKAASHLPQQAGFFKIRDLIVGQTPQLVQDETGVAYKHLDGPFDVKLFGTFRAVNGLFDGRPQQALKQAYASRKDVAPLPFTIGYRKAAGSALMVATRRAPQELRP